MGQSGLPPQLMQLRMRLQSGQGGIWHERRACRSLHLQ